MDIKRQRVSDLLDAAVPITDIVKIVECHKSFVFKVKAMKKAGKSLARSPGSGGHNKIRSEEFLTGVACAIEADPTASIRSMAKDLGVSEKTIRRSVGDLGAFSYVRRKRQLLTEATKARRVEKGRKLLNWLKSNSSTVRIFSDKKNWTVDQARNSRNDRYLAYCVDEVPPINATKHPQSAMMLGVVSSDGKKMPPYWFPKGLKVGTQEYLHVLQTVVKPWIDQNYPNGGYVWQQDSAPSHKSKQTQDWCKANLKKFWPWTIWPPSSPDLSPLDYGIWGNVERKACARSHRNVDELKASVEEHWASMEEDFIKRTCSAFRPRLEAMLEAGGGHFEN